MVNTADADSLKKSENPPKVVPGESAFYEDISKTSPGIFCSHNIPDKADKPAFPFGGYELFGHE